MEKTFEEIREQVYEKLEETERMAIVCNNSVHTVYLNPEEMETYICETIDTNSEPYRAWKGIDIHVKTYDYRCCDIFEMADTDRDDDVSECVAYMTDCDKEKFENEMKKIEQEYGSIDWFTKLEWIEKNAYYAYEMRIDDLIDYIIECDRDKNYKIAEKIAYEYAE